MASPCSRLRCEVSCAADACLDRVAPDAVESARMRSAMEPPAGSSTDSPLFFFFNSASMAAFIVKNCAAASEGRAPPKFFHSADARSR